MEDGRPIPMTDWTQMMQDAMALEQADPIAAHAAYGRCVQAALVEVQGSLDASELARGLMEQAYVALAAYAQQTMMRMRAEDPEAGGVDHAFRAGQAYGVSCVLNHVFDETLDLSAGSLGILDDFSDMLHDDVIGIAREVDLTVELLDAKGDYLDE